VKKVVYSVAPPKSKDNLSENSKKPSSQATDKNATDPDQPAIINNMVEVVKKNPLTLRPEDGSFAVDLLLRQFLEDKDATDSIFYYLKLIKLHDKTDVPSPHQINDAIRELKDWKSLRPLSLFGLIGPEFCCTFLQMFALDGISQHYHDELVLALIPALVGFLVNPTNVVCPVSEYLTELASKSPNNVGARDPVRQRSRLERPLAEP